MLKTGARFSFRDKLLFGKSEVEITRVDCIYAIYTRAYRTAQLVLLQSLQCLSFSIEEKKSARGNLVT